MKKEEQPMGYEDGKPCGHTGCLQHVTHPCENCGRIAGHEVPEHHPFQTPLPRRKQYTVPKNIALAAYEVYCNVYGPQVALVTGNCRGGFGAMELIVFLYAKTRPESEWKYIVNGVF
jgi:hypothetical protein